MPAREPLVNYIGKKFGRLTILGDSDAAKVAKKRRVIAQCECGTIREYSLNCIKKGDTKSCGCIIRDQFYSVIGNKYGKLTAIEELMRVRNKRIILVQCECGNRTTALLTNLLSENTVSCGCHFKKVLGERNKTHGLSDHLLYGVWGNIRTRCTNPNVDTYANYGGRGICICDEWLNDFMSFYNWAIEAGWMKGKSIERKNNDGHYEPSNCKIGTEAIQARNKRSNIYLEYNGKRMVVMDWSKELGIPFTTITQRLKMKLPIKMVLSQKKLPRGSSNVPRSVYLPKS